jgi:hypothetical protein
MGPEHSTHPPPDDPPALPPQASPSLDQPVEAIVYDEHPALAPPRPFGRSTYRGHEEYPYAAPRNARLPAANSQPDAVTDFFESIAHGVKGFVNAVTKEPEYVVPKRFGMSAILGIMTALAVVFGILRFVNAEPYFYAFFAIESLTICLAQMLYGKAPRLASVVAGAVILPLFTIVASRFSENLHPGEVFCMSIGFIPFGALLGYITGTCAAGVFLVMDKAENYFKGERGLAALPPGRPA